MARPSRSTPAASAGETTSRVVSIDFINPKTGAKRQLGYTSETASGGQMVVALVEALASAGISEFVADSGHKITLSVRGGGAATTLEDLLG